MKISSLFCLITTSFLMFSLNAFAAPAEEAPASTESSIAPAPRSESDATSIASKPSYSSAKMPSYFRVGFSGGVGLLPFDGKYENKLQTETSTGLVTLTAGLGKGMLSLEAGVAAFKTADILKSGDHRLLVSSVYYGFPVYAKWNYIERPLATFFIKAGAIPVTIARQTEDAGLTSVQQSTLAIYGVGGSTEINDRLAFVLDITALQNLGEKGRGIPDSIVTLGAGLSFDL